MEVTTSGSTGVPKKIRLQKEHMRASAQKTLRYLNLQPGDRSLLCLPVSKIAGMMMLVRWVEGGLDLWPVPPSSTPIPPGESFDFAAMVPLQVKESLDSLHRIGKLIIGGGAIDPELEKQLRPMPGAIYHTYGMTETISHVAMRRINGNEAMDYFEAVPGVSFSQDQRQCLVIDAPDIGVKGMITNDVVETLDGQRFRWLGRADNVVNSGGVKLHPELLEQKTGNVGFDYFLAGMPDERLGEKLVLVIDRETEIREEKINKLLAALQGYERPREVYTAQFFYSINTKLQRQKTLEEGNLQRIR